MAFSLIICMETLENMLEINLAILGQKNYSNSTLPSLVEALFKKNGSFADIDSKAKVKKKGIKGFQQEPNISPLKKEEKQPYGPFEVFKDYISAAKNILYGYYSKARGKFAGFAGVGYTDKLLKEFEDYGVVYFKTVFKKLQRLTPLGIVQRHLEGLWIYMAKKIK